MLLEPLQLLKFPNQLQICSAEKNTLKKNVEIMPLPPFLIFFTTPLRLSAYVYMHEYIFLEFFAM